VTTERRNRLEEVAHELQALADEVSTLSEAMPGLLCLSAQAVAHEIAVSALTLLVVRRQVPDVE